MYDVMFAAHTERLAQLRAEADRERLLRSVKQAKARGKRVRRQWWRALAGTPRRTARPA
jgi:hypothetical protein